MQLHLSLATKDSWSYAAHKSPATPCRSYPFFDPVLTDRAFLNEPRTMVKSFTLGGTVAGIFILLFGFFGMFGNMQAILRPDACVLPPRVSRSLLVPILLRSTCLFAMAWRPHSSFRVLAHSMATAA